MTVPIVPREEQIVHQPRGSKDRGMMTLRKLLIKLTGGRPMTNLGYAFTDTVAGRPVYHWRDRLGRGWMANGAWSIFRVRRSRLDAQE